jgi:hypothetical protein
MPASPIIAHPGTEATFAAAGFTEVSRPTLRRAVVRIDV